MKVLKLLVLGLGLLPKFAFSDGGSITVGPANPAIMNCVELGGGYDFTENNDLVCRFEMNTFHEKLLLGLSTHLTQNHQFVGMPNPYAISCELVNGTMVDQTLCEVDANAFKGIIDRLYSTGSL